MMMIMTTMYNISFCVLCCVMLGVAVLAYAGVAYTADDDDNYYIVIEENIVKKLGRDNTIEINGRLPYGNANMTVTYPDGITQAFSSLTVTQNGHVNSFIFLDDDSSLPGLYVVDVVSYSDGDDDGGNSNDEHDMTSHFFLSDYDGVVEIHVVRDAVTDCIGNLNDEEDVNDNISLHGGCMSPETVHIPETFGMRIINSDYRNHQFNVDGTVTDVILPDGDAVVYLSDSGEHQYYCIIHPWIGGTVVVTDVKSLKFSPKSLAKDQLGIIDRQIQQGADDAIVPGVIPFSNYDDSCSMCYVGEVTKIVDGDTIEVDKKRVRLSLVDTPEKREDGFEEATEHTRKTCPVGTFALIDIDDQQPHDRFGRAIAKVICGTTNLNASLLENNHAITLNIFCPESEFRNDDWNSCPADKITPPLVFEKPDETKPQNTTANTNATIFPQIPYLQEEQEDYIMLIFLSVVILLIAICLCIVYMKKSNSATSSKDSTTWNYRD